VTMKVSIGTAINLHQVTKNCEKITFMFKFYIYFEHYYTKALWQSKGPKIYSLPQSCLLAD